MARLILCAVVAAVLPWAAPAAAGESLWGYVYGAETLPKGGTELYLWATDRRGKRQGSYDAQDYSLELEHGLTNRLQGSVYVNFRSHDIRGAAPLDEAGQPEYPDVKRDFGFQGVQGSLMYNILSPYKDGIGVAVYVEPGYSRIFKISGQKQDEFSFETKLLVQKNFLDDRLITAVNLTLEQEFRKFRGDDDWGKELELEVTAGVSYRVAANWHLGLEGRYHSEYPGFPSTVEREHYAFFGGPNVHYASKHWWATLTYLPQLWGGPNDPARSSSLHLSEHEVREIRLKVAYVF